MNILFSLPDNLVQKLDKLAEERQVTRSALLRMLVCTLLKEPIPAKRPPGPKPKSDASHT